MPTLKNAAKKPAKKVAKKAAKKTAKKTAPALAPRLTLEATMKALEQAGSAQTRKTYARHGAPEPMFGVSFATLKVLYKRIGVDQALAEALWNTGNFDALNLAVKIADPAAISSKELDRWAKTPTARMCGAYVAHIAAEGPHGRTKAEKWLAASDESTRFAGWSTLSALALLDESTDDAWFAQWLKQIEETIHAAPNTQRYLMNHTLIAVGCRNASLCKSATAAAKRIGTVDVDHGDTSCKTPVAVDSIAKSWAHSKSKGFDSPAAHERSRESMRTRC